MGEGNMFLSPHPFPSAQAREPALGAWEMKGLSYSNQKSEPWTSLGWSSRAGPDGVRKGEVDPRVRDHGYCPCFLLSAALGEQNRGFELTDPNNLLINPLLEFVKGPDLQIQSYIISKKQNNRVQ